MPNENLTAASNKLIEDFKTLSSDVQELMKATASVVSEKAVEARAKVEESLKIAQEKLSDVKSQVKEKSDQAVGIADEYVKDNPWTAVGVAAGIGFIAGVTLALSALVRRR